MILRWWYYYEMTLSRQEASRNISGRTNQKARTRTALLTAASELVREGKAASMPDAADRALVSVATAYRYFSSAEELWWEASKSIAFEEGMAEGHRRIDEAGNDPRARVEALIRSTGFRTLDDQVPYRQMAKAALDQWFRQIDVPEGERVPIREGRRNEQITSAIAPLRDELSQKDVDRIAHALALVIGSEAMLTLIDAVGLDVATAKRSMLDAGRWLLDGALAELTDRPS
jgi:AcrR family transcriptional regulator